MKTVKSSLSILWGEVRPPKPSLQRSAIGRPPGRHAAVVYAASRGPAGLLSSPACLERWASRPPPACIPSLFEHELP